MSRFETLAQRIEDDQYRLILEETRGSAPRMVREYREPTEYIVSLAKKKAIIDALQEYNQKDIPALIRLLTVLNRFHMTHPSIERLYTYLCSHVHAELLANTMCITRYESPETIPHPTVEQLRIRLEKKGLVLGDYSSYRCYVMFMIGSPIGYVIVDGNRILHAEYDTPLIQLVFEKQHPFEK